MVYKPLKKKEFRISCCKIKISQDAFFLNFPGKGWISKNDIEKLTGILSAFGSCQRIMKLDMRFFELVEVKIENCDLHHVGVIVIACEGVLLYELPLCWLEQSTVNNTTCEVCGFRVVPEDMVEIGR